MKERCDFGFYLRQKRKELNISQQDLAKIIGVHRTYVSRLESKGGNPNFKLVQQIAKSLSVSLPEFFRALKTETSQPLIVVNLPKKDLDLKQKEHVMQFKTIPIPIIKNNAAIKSKAIPKEDITDYILLNEAILKNHAKEKLIAYHHDPSKPLDLAVVSLDDKKLIEQAIYLIDYKGTKPYRHFIAKSGETEVLVFHSILDIREKPLCFHGRQKDFLKVFGRVIFIFEAV